MLSHKYVEGFQRLIIKWILKTASAQISPPGVRLHWPFISSVPHLCWAEVGQWIKIIRFFCSTKKIWPFLRLTICCEPFSQRNISRQQAFNLNYIYDNQQQQKSHWLLWWKSLGPVLHRNVFWPIKLNKNVAFDRVNALMRTKLQIPCRYPTYHVCHLSRPLPKKMLLCCSCTQYLADFLIYQWHNEQYWCVTFLSALKLSQCVAFSSFFFVFLARWFQAPMTPSLSSEESDLVPVCLKVFCKRKWWGFFHLQSVLFSWLYSCMSFRLY